MDHTGSVDILVVEDDASQRESIVASIETATDDLMVAAVGSSDEALAVLFDAGLPNPPRLVLLDLSLAEDHGFDILRQIRTCANNKALACVPIVIFTDSNAESDIQEGFRLGANSYVFKPLGFLDFQHTVGAVVRYWLNNNQAPGHENSNR